MSTRVLAPESALSPGSELWILPDMSKSKWTSKLDWYLNFQLTKSTRNKPPMFAEFLTQTVTEAGIDTINLSVNNQSPFMIASHDLLPNKWVVVVPWTHNHSAWISKSFEVWNNLNRPSIRLFLPPGQSAGAFEREWQIHDAAHDLTLVLD